MRTELAFAVLVHLHLAESERGVGRLCEGFRANGAAARAATRVGVFMGRGGYGEM